MAFNDHMLDKICIISHYCIMIRSKVLSILGLVSIAFLLIRCKQPPESDGLGTIFWTAYSGLRVMQPPAIGKNGYAYVVGVNGEICYYNMFGKNVGCNDTPKRRGERIFAAPVIWWNGDGRIMVVTDRGTVYAFGKYVPSIIWKTTLDVPVYNTPAVYGDSTMYITANRYVFRLNVRSGEVLFRKEICESYDPSVGSEGTVYLACKDGNVVAMGVEGKIKWKVNLGKRIVGRVILDGDSVRTDRLLIPVEGGELYVLSSSGRVEGVSEYYGSEIFVDREGNVYSEWQAIGLGRDVVLVHDGTQIRLVDRFSGADVWVYKLPFDGARRVFANMGFGKLWLVSEDGRLAMLSLNFNYDNTWWGVRHHDRANSGCPCDP